MLYILTLQAFQPFYFKFYHVHLYTNKQNKNIYIYSIKYYNIKDTVYRHILIYTVDIQLN